MDAEYLIGLDYGTESARGVLIDVATGAVCASHARNYRHGTLTRTLPNGTALPADWALQNAADYLECAETILSTLGRDKRVMGIGIGFTASSPLPVSSDGTALSERFPHQPHAYVKLWKHHSAQPWADKINQAGGNFLDKFGGKTSGEWLPAKAAQLAAESPELWVQTARFIEAGDWLVWQLTGQEVRSSDMARYKAHYSAECGYPDFGIVDLEGRLSAPALIGSTAGAMCAAWRERTGIRGQASVAVASIDSHVILPALGAVDARTLVGALGTSAVFMLLDDEERPLPAGIEGVAKDAALPDLWCYEAGQAGFGDVLAWFVKATPLAEDTTENFAAYNAAAASLRAGESGLLALDWWSGCRVPYSDLQLNGLLVGLRVTTTPVDIYRALLESLCFGARHIVEHLRAGGVAIDRTIVASGLSKNNPLLVQIMADVLNTKIAVPDLPHATAVGAAIHGSVAAGVVRNFQEGSARFGARNFRWFEPEQPSAGVYDVLYAEYRALAEQTRLRKTMHVLAGLALRAQG